MWDDMKLWVLAGAVCLGGCAASRPMAGLGEMEQVGEDDRVAFNRAVELTSRLEYSAAANEFSRLGALFERAGAVSEAAEATFWQGYCHEKLDRFGQAELFYSRCIRMYPDSAGADQARRRLSRMETIPR